MLIQCAFTGVSIEDSAKKARSFVVDLTDLICLLGCRFLTLKLKSRASIQVATHRQLLCLISMAESFRVFG